MRIIAGDFRGRALASVGKGDAAAHLRPTSDRTRESLFNILASGRYGDVLEQARVLDLFAGTGALGLEALSRRAAHATFVDDGRKSLALIRHNIALCNAVGRSTVLTCDARRLRQNPDAPYGLIFADPPYGAALGEIALAQALAMGWIAPAALIVWEESRPIAPPEGLEIIEQRRYGKSTITLLEAS